MNVWENIKTTFRRGDALVKAIYVNAGVFFALKVAVIVLKAVQPARPAALLVAGHARRPGGVAPPPVDAPHLHVPARRVLPPVLQHAVPVLVRQALPHRLFRASPGGGSTWWAGWWPGAFYAVAFNLFPYYEPLVHASILMGASGSIMAITVATAFRLPNMEIRLFLVGGEVEVRGPGCHRGELLRHHLAQRGWRAGTPGRGAHRIPLPSC